MITSLCPASLPEGGEGRSFMALCSPALSGSETNCAAALGDAFPPPGALQEFTATTQQRGN